MTNALISLRCLTFCLFAIALTSSKAEAQSIVYGTNIVGPNCTAGSSASYAAALGDACSVNNVGAMAIGTNCGASGEYSVSLGAYNETTGVGSSCLGWGNVSNGLYSLCVGAGNTSTATASLATGGNSVAGGNYSFAANSGTVANGAASASFGGATQANSYLEFVLGKYNLGRNGTSYNQTAWVPTDPLFEIGNGASSSSLSDALIIYKNGNATLQGVLTAAPGGDIPMYSGN